MQEPPSTDEGIFCARKCSKIERKKQMPWSALHPGQLDLGVSYV